jgi:hypothetical protein
MATILALWKQENFATKDDWRPILVQLPDDEEAYE